MSALFNKLNLKDQGEILVLNAPDSFQAELDKLSDVRIERAIKNVKETQFVLAFVTNKAEVDKITVSLKNRVKGDAVVWFAYPKASSRKYKCDFNRDTGWSALGKAGFEGVRMVAIDEDWTALRFRRVEFIKSMTRDRKRAITGKGKKKAAKSRK